MSVTSVASQQLLSTFGQGSSYDNSLDAIGYDDFLTLLIAELKHQDPMQPMESSEFTSQLAQFSSVEQLYGIKEIMGDVQQSIAAQSEQNPVDFIGKTITTADDTVVLQGGAAQSGYYTLAQAADATVKIYNGDGELVRTLYMEDQAAGKHAVEWDGTSDQGLKVSNGIYYFDVSAKNSAGQNIAVSDRITGEVTGITYAYGDSYFMMGDRLVSAQQDIVEVRQSETTEP